MASNIQPALAPAPHRLGPHPDTAADHSLAQHLGAHLHSTQATARLDMANAGAGNPHDQNIDPAIAGPGMINTSAGESGPDENSMDTKKGGKRELSTSKRAAQNRAAQRAFRQRKEGHIKELESQVKDYNNLLQRFNQLQAENYGLRDYIISLQSRLLEAQAEFPQPPPNLDIDRRSSASQQQPLTIPTAQMGTVAATPLQISGPNAAGVNDSKASREVDVYTDQSQTSKKPRNDEEVEPKTLTRDHENKILT